MSRAKNSKGIYRRGRVWWITYQGLDGKQHFESSGSALKADAEYLLACRKKAIAEGTAPPITSRRVQKTTFNELAERYLEFIQGQKAIATKRGFIREMKKRNSAG